MPVEIFASKNNFVSPDILLPPQLGATTLGASLQSAGTVSTELSASARVASPVSAEVSDDPLLVKFNRLLNDYYHKQKKHGFCLVADNKIPVDIFINRRRCFSNFVKKHPGYFDFHDSKHSGDRIVWRGSLSPDVLYDFYDAMKKYRPDLSDLVRSFVMCEYSDNKFLDKECQEKIRQAEKKIRKIQMDDFVGSTGFSLYEASKKPGALEANIASWYYEKKIKPMMGESDLPGFAEPALIINKFARDVTGYFSRVAAVYLNKGLYGFDTTLDGQKLRQEIASCFVDHLDSLLKQRIDADQVAYLKNIGSYKTGSLSDFSGLNKYITKHHDTGDARKNCIALAGALVAESSHEVALTGIIERINQGFDLVKSAREQCVRQKVQECVITLLEKELAPESSLKAPVGSMSDVSNAFCSALREGEKRIASASASLQALRLLVKVPADAIGDSFSELFQQCEIGIVTKKKQLSESLLTFLHDGYCACAPGQFPQARLGEDSSSFCLRCNEVALRVCETVRSSIRRARASTLFHESVSSLDTCQQCILSSIHRMQKPAYLRGSKLIQGWFARGFGKLGPIKKILFGVAAVTTAVLAGATIIGACVVTGGVLALVLMLGTGLSLCSLGVMSSILWGGVRDGRAKDSVNQRLLEQFDRCFIPSPAC